MKIFILIILISVLSGSIYSEPISIGVKAGLSFPNLTGGNEEINRDYRTRTDFNIGGIVEFRLNSTFSLQPEIDYVGQGGTRTGVQPIIADEINSFKPDSIKYLFGDFRNEAILGYLEIPLLLKIYPMESHNLFVYIGPYAGLLVHAVTKTSGKSPIYLDKDKQPLPAPYNTLIADFNANTNVIEKLHSFNFGVQIGFGYKYRLTESSYFFAEGRVSYGLLIIQRDTIKNGSTRTGGLLVYLGYMFFI